MSQTIRYAAEAGLKFLCAFFALSFAVACGSEPQILHQRMQVSLHGGGRDIDAELTYACHRPQGSSPYAYVPEANGALHVAPDGEAVAVGGTQELSPGLCTYPGDRWNGSEGGGQTPLILWVDNINRPTAVDAIDPAPASKQAKFLSPELVRFSLQWSQTRFAHAAAGQTRPLSATYGRLLSSKPGEGAQFTSPARVLAALEFADDAERRQFLSLLGDERAPGAREIGFCNLARVSGAAAYLRERHPAVVHGCKGGAPILPGTIRFSVPLPMKRVDGTHWAASSADYSASFVRDPGAPLVARGITPNGDLVARSASFWTKTVSKVTWVADEGRRYTLSVQGPMALYFSDDDNVVLLVDDVSIVYLTDPSEWVKK